MVFGQVILMSHCVRPWYFKKANELVEMITYYDETERDLDVLLKWKNGDEGKKSNFPKIDEM